MNHDNCSTDMPGAEAAGDDRQALDVDAADDRLVDRAWQDAADFGDLVLDVVERAVDVDRPDLELNDGGRRAVGHC